MKNGLEMLKIVIFIFLITRLFQISGNCESYTDCCMQNDVQTHVQTFNFTTLNSCGYRLGVLIESVSMRHFQ